MDDNVKRTTWPRTLLLAAVAAAAVTLGAFVNEPERAEADCWYYGIGVYQNWWAQGWIPCGSDRPTPPFQVCRDENGQLITTDQPKPTTCVTGNGGDNPPANPANPSNPGSGSSPGGSTGGGGTGPTGPSDPDPPPVEPDDLFQDFSPDLRDLLLDLLGV